MCQFIEGVLAFPGRIIYMRGYVDSRTEMDAKNNMENRPKRNASKPVRYQTTSSDEEPAKRRKGSGETMEEALQKLRNTLEDPVKFQTNEETSYANMYTYTPNSEAHTYVQPTQAYTHTHIPPISQIDAYTPQTHIHITQAQTHISHTSAYTPKRHSYITEAHTQISHTNTYTPQTNAHITQAHTQISHTSINTPKAHVRITQTAHTQISHTSSISPKAHVRILQAHTQIPHTYTPQTHIDTLNQSTYIPCTHSPLQIHTHTHQGRNLDIYTPPPSQTYKISATNPFFSTYHESPKRDNVLEDIPLECHRSSCQVQEERLQRIEAEVNRTGAVVDRILKLIQRTAMKSAPRKPATLPIGSLQALEALDAMSEDMTIQML